MGKMGYGIKMNHIITLTLCQPPVPKNTTCCIKIIIRLYYTIVQFELSTKVKRAKSLEKAPFYCSHLVILTNGIGGEFIVIISHEVDEPTQYPQ